jgi:hypothetical protein
LLTIILRCDNALAMPYMWVICSKTYCGL